VERRRVEGSLKGYVFGDIIGSPYEGGRLEEFYFFEDFDQLVEHVLRTLRVLTTDDTGLVVATLRGMLRGRGKFRERFLVEEFLRWFEEDGFGVGRVTGEVLRLWKEGEDFERASLKVAEKYSGRLGGTGPLMRCLPLAFFATDLQELWEMADRSSYLTHLWEEAGYFARFYLTLLRLLLEGMEPSDAYASALDVFQPRDSMAFTAAVEAAKMEEYEIVPSFYIYDVFKNVMCLFLRSDVVGAFRKTLTVGGDTDTQCALLGGLFGAVMGPKVVPLRLRTVVNEIISEELLSELWEVLGLDED